MVFLDFMEEHPSISLTVSIITLSTLVYVGLEGFSVLNPDHRITTLFYSSFSLMVIYSVFYLLKARDIDKKFNMRINIFLWFTTALLSTRLLVRAAGIGNPTSNVGNLGFIPFNQLWIGGYHIHHYFFGLILIFCSNMLLLEKEEFSRIRAGILFGAGLGLLFDEIGFLLSMGNYSSVLTYPISLVMGVLLFFNTFRSIFGASED